MQDLLSKIDQAKTDNRALDTLLAEYLPFIRQEAGRQTALGIEYDDRVIIGMVAFVNCVRQYRAGRGSFLSYVARAIHNRLVDEGRRQARAAYSTVPLEGDAEEGGLSVVHERASLQAHARRQTRAALAEEIALLSAQLQVFHIRFEDLDKRCPKHARLRQQCIQAAAGLARDPGQARRLMETGRLPISYLAKRFDMPVKTLEKFRKYLVAIAVICIGDYPHIQTFIPLQEEAPV